MKTIFTLLLTTFFTTAFAYNEGRLTISVAAEKNIQLVVDGRNFEDRDNNFVFNDIRPGNHTIKIYKKNRNSYGKNDRWDNNELIYSSVIYVKPSYHVDVVVNRFGRALVDERALYDQNDRWNGNTYYDADNNGYNSYKTAMSSTGFQQLVAQVKAQWFGSARLNTAKSGIRNNYFSTAQVRQLLQIFTSDSDKLEVARQAYGHTVDQRNYYGLNDVFSFQSSRDALADYISSYRP